MSDSKMSKGKIGEKIGEWIKGFGKETEKLKEKLWVRASNWTHGWLEAEQVESPEKEVFQNSLQSDETYVEIRLKSMRIPYQRIMARKYFGAVHSFASLGSLVTGVASGRASFNVVTTPTMLQKVDAKNLSRVIQTDIPLLGPVPYRGGDIDVEIGLFSVMEDNLVIPFLKVVEDISKAGSVSIVSQAIPFVQPIENAIYHLIGASDSNKLEIGIKTSLSKTGYLVAIGADREDQFFSGLKLHKDGKLFEGETEITDLPYMVLTVKALTGRSNYYEIPEILKALQNLLTACKTGNKESIDEFYGTFERETRNSAELLTNDANGIIQRIYQKHVEPELKKIEAKATRAPVRKIEPAVVDINKAKAMLKEIDLYKNPS